MLMLKLEVVMMTGLNYKLYMKLILGMETVLTKAK